jgi:CIC family chloride channel protein
LGWQMAGLLLFTNLVATFACYGFDGCGGIFSPTLFLGGMCGLLISGLSGLAFHMPGPDHLVLAVVGMSACLGAVVGAPVTGILIVFEMTHQFSLVPALMVGALVSQAVRRRLSKHTFYEELLVQDGHHLQHVIPPRDLHSWQQLPVSAIANFQPVTLTELAPEEIQKAIKAHPYQRFPVLRENTIAGILTRREAELSVAEKRPPRLENAVTCLPNQTIRQLQGLLIESTSLIVILLDRPGGRAIGLVTLHDLLRSEVAMGKAQG